MPWFSYVLDFEFLSHKQSEVFPSLMNAYNTTIQHNI